MKNRTLCSRLLCLILLAGILSLFFCGCSQETGTDACTAVFYKIGKADAILLYGDTFSVLVDTGEDTDTPEILQKMKNAGITSLDYLILTHFDKDHIGGAPAILASVPVKTILMPAYTGEGTPYEALLACREELGLTFTTLTEDLSFTCGEVSFSVSVPKQLIYEKKQDNNSSLVVTVTCGQNSLLLAGDAEQARQAELISGGLSPVTLLKVPHHGVYNKKIEDFFAAAMPTYAIITCYDKNPAEEETIAALEALGTKVYETVNGDITVHCTKEKITVYQDASTS